MDFSTLGKWFGAAAVVCVICLIAFYGCSNSAPVFVAAKGRVVYADGKPVGNARVNFWPMDDPKGFVRLHKSIPFSGMGPSGDFDVVMSSQQEGAPPGKYRITVEMVDSAKSKLIPERYHNWQTTPLIETIPRSGRTDLLLKIE